jgi:hypothetical protein
MKGPADHRSIVYRGVFSSQRPSKGPRVSNEGVSHQGVELIFAKALWRNRRDVFPFRLLRAFVASDITPSHERSTSSNSFSSPSGY